MDESAAMQRFFDQKVAEIARLSRISLIDGHEVPVCNCPPMFASEVGHRLLDDHPLRRSSLAIRIKEKRAAIRCAPAMVAWTCQR